MATFIGECPQSKDVLQEAQIDVITNKKCRKSWKESINDGHICVYDKNENKGSCNVSYFYCYFCKRLYKSHEKRQENNVNQLPFFWPTETKKRLEVTNNQTINPLPLLNSKCKRK